MLAVVAPEALVVALLATGFTGTLGAATTAVAELAAGYTDFSKATGIYDTIKGYGTQI
jgi:hypothetical protein